MKGSQAEMVYECFVQNFSEQGNFEAVTARLDEICSLDMDVLWLMPIHPIGEQGRKGSEGSPYAIQDYEKIHPSLGNSENLRNLIKKAHGLGLKVIIDIVANHVSLDARIVKEHPEWIYHDESGNLSRKNPDWSDIYYLDYEQRGLWECMQGMMRGWIQDYELDGFRCDVADYIPLEFWADTILKLKKSRSTLIFLAEAEGKKMYECGFDLSYNWKLYDRFQPFLKNSSEPAAKIISAIQQALNTCRGGGKMLNFIENHDKPRAASYLGEDAEEVALGMIMTLPGIPLIYQGQEIGTKKDCSIFEKNPVDWKRKNRKIERMHKKWIEIRRRIPWISDGFWEPVENQDENIASYRVTGKERIHVFAAPPGHAVPLPDGEIVYDSMSFKVGLEK